MFDFKIIKECSSTKARLGTFSTPHGNINTPCFMPVGTKGVVKTLTPDDLHEIGTEIILANTYHLELRPGSKLVAKMGGLHKWTGWNGPMLTDSGGFQVFSLNEGKYSNNRKTNLVKVSNEGVEFRSHLDGSKHFFTPEKAIEIEHDLGADIIMAFDECVSSDTTKKYTKEAMDRTHKWLERCIRYHRSNVFQKQALFGIIQGGMYEDLRKISANFVANTDIEGIAIGGLSVGEEKSIMYSIIDTVIPELPKNKIRYLMGVGDPIDLIECIIRGVDIFDCVLPTRIARHGTAMTDKGNINLLNKKYFEDNAPIMKSCICTTCKKHSRSYIRHLIKENEITGLKLVTIHNINYLFNLINEIRIGIKTDSLDMVIKKYRNI